MTEPDVYVSTGVNKSAFHESEDCGMLQRSNEYMAVPRSEVEGDLKECRMCTHQQDWDTSELGVTPSGKNKYRHREKREAYLLFAVSKLQPVGAELLQSKFGALGRVDGWPVIHREHALSTYINHLEQLVQKGLISVDGGEYCLTAKGEKAIENSERDPIRVARFAVANPKIQPKDRVLGNIKNLAGDEIRAILTPDGDKYQFGLDEIKSQMDIPLIDVFGFKIDSELRTKMQELIADGNAGEMIGYIHPELQLEFENGRLKTASVANNEPQHILNNLPWRS